MRAPSARRLFLGLAFIGLTGCVHVGQQQEQPWRLYSLSPMPEPEAEPAGTLSSSGPAQSAIGVGPIHLPGYLDQDQIVTRMSDNRIALSESDRWAEPLQDNMAQVLAQNLGMQLRADRVIVHPWPGQRRPTYQLEIDVLSFETDTSGGATLEARWLLRDVAGRRTIAEQETRLTAAAADTSSERMVASLSKALGDFSVAIARVITSIDFGRAISSQRK